MKHILAVLLIVLFAFTLQAQDRFGRSAIIPAAPDDIGGFGHLLAGLDIDGDGQLEIYAVNTDWHDVLGKDLIPRIYKYEQDADGKWQTVWSTRLPFDFQNTWAALAYGDLDNDGKQEIVWGPVNNFGGGLNANPPRIVVFETPGDGSDNMGVDNGDGTWAPNAQWTITALDNDNVRPFRWIITDIDGDGAQEIVTALRGGNHRGQIYAVSDIPDNGDGSETWTIEWEGLGTNTHYDLAIIGSSVYYIRSGGDVTKVTYDAAGDSFTVAAPQNRLVGNGTTDGGSWKSAATVDVDGDGTEEIIVASWDSGSRNVYLLQQSGDSLTATIISSPPAESNRLYGGAAGDVDGDGLLDFVFGTRQATPNGVIHRLEYQGGAIDDPANWDLSVMDSGVSAATQYDIIEMADLDADGEDEVVYSGTPRGLSADDRPQPIVVLDRIPVNQPNVKRVTDVPNDQGRQVWVVWQGAADDALAPAAASNDISVAVSAPEGVEFPNMAFNGKALVPTYVDAESAQQGAVISQYVVWRIDNGLPVQVAEVVAIQSGMYAAVVPTLGDGPDWRATYVVSSHTADPLTNWKSFPGRGYSTDNLAPAAPANLNASEGETATEAPFVQLSWDEAVDEDFDFFTVIRGTSSGFDVNSAEVIAELTETSFTDENVNTGETFFYRVAATDFNGNLGNFSEEVSLVITSVGGSNGALPEKFALQQNYPNPFNPTTQITYDLAADANVSLKIFNMRGQEIRTLVNESKSAGSYTIQWNARDNSGLKVASGVYIYMIKAGDFNKARRLTLLK